ncbi:type VII secretion target [Aestuariimicrobium ganziense]|uniref:type VII secretion target n=1 Tax=Aestuariimicrobium ganziense TaxID=2773677 RepID=UPI001943AE53|nr:type VII secretion target [Aestuariimicrobium ganziense]
MSDFTVDPDELDAAASSVGDETSTITGLAAGVHAPSSQACGILLSQAFRITFPSATDGATDFVTALGGAVDSISTRLTQSATHYRQTEADAVELADTVWEGP